MSADNSKRPTSESLKVNAWGKYKNYTIVYAYISIYYVKYLIKIRDT